MLVRVRVSGRAVRPTPVAGKVRETGLMEMPGGATPIPLSKTVWVRN